MSDNREQEAFWNEFIRYAKGKTSLCIPSHTGEGQYFRRMAQGCRACIVLVMNGERPRRIRCEIYIGNDKTLFAQLASRKGDITRELSPYTLDWESHQVQVRRIKTDDPVPFILDDKASWSGHFDWMLKAAERFYKVFGKEL